VSGPVVHALIPAAGRGQRFGGSVLKQYFAIGGKPVLAHAIDGIGRAPGIAGITVVIAADDRLFGDLVQPGHPGVATVTGGASRAESVLNGLRSIRARDPAADWVLVHDAARPCLPRRNLLDLLVQGLKCPDGAILAIPVRDTLKADRGDGHIDATVERSGLWAAQTPQLFPLDRLSRAVQDMLDAGETPTDEAAAMERAGARPLLVMGSPVNIKITWPADVGIAEAWLQGKSMAE
jgi:2-C-methyl-D-erythritol 4-phosphate cytidylyltransferase